MDEECVASGGVDRQPLTLLPPQLRTMPLPSPKQLVILYDPDQFEEFVKEWVPALDVDYHLVERHGGSGDHGIDVAGYLTPQRLEGEWHNYQCKHYSNGLAWGTAAHEMRKMFAAAVDRHFTVPSRYVFTAPIISRGLIRQLAKPSEAREKFLQELTSTTDKIFTDLNTEKRHEVTELAAATDFSMFECADMDVMLEQHRKTPHWSARFSHQAVEGGPEPMAPPPEHQPIEARYIQQLMAVYRERWGQSMSSLEQVVAHAVAREHLRRQREAFYSAEALRLFARDRTPEGHFEAVLDDISDIVVEVAAATHVSGWDRLQAALQAAGSIVLTQTVLSPFVRSKDRVGACHHLANVDRLIWCPEGES